MKRPRVEGKNGLHTFTFSKKVRHGSGYRDVEIDVPVKQVLELADQFRACRGGPAHAVWHLRRPQRDKTCREEPDQAEREGGRFFCRPCYATARGMDVHGDRLCPTCQQPTLVKLEDASQGKADMLAEMLNAIEDDGVRAHLFEAITDMERWPEGSEDYEIAATAWRTFLAVFEAGKRIGSGS